MKFIPRKLHAVIDILLVLVLLAYPWLFIEGPHSTETMIMLVAGIAVLCYAMLSKYELGVYKYMNFKNHLSLDFVIGMMLLTAPWLWGFGPRIMWPHVVIGALFILLALCSRNESIPIDKQQEVITF